MHALQGGKTIYRARTELLRPKPWHNNDPVHELVNIYQIGCYKRY